MRTFYQGLPSWLKIIVLNGVIQTLLLAQSWLTGETANLRMFALVWVGCAINLFTHLSLKEKDQK